MNPFDDTLPEEHEPQYQELTTMLQQVSRKPAFVAPDRQARMLADVRRLLEITASERVAGQDDMSMCNPMCLSSEEDVASIGSRGWSRSSLPFW